MEEKQNKIKEQDGQKVVWVSCRAEGGKCDGKEAVLLSCIKTGDQKSVNLVRYQCMTCKRVFSVSY